MPLPQHFQFSQSNLDDFQTCPRRFQLRYLEQLRWPASQAEPAQEVERLAQLGQDFHRLVHQHLVGLEVDTLTASLPLNNDELRHLWENYLNHHPRLDNAQLYPELTLSAPLGGFRLLARFDLLASQPDGTFLIVDWKTSQRRPPRPTLAARIQSRVYPYVLAKAGRAFNGGRPLKAATIKMMYWYAHFPTAAESFAYSPGQLEQDEQFLSNLIDHINQAAQANHFPLVEDEQPCAHCVYRSYCNRGTQAGPLVEWEMAEPEPSELALDWEQIGEIQF